MNRLKTTTTLARPLCRHLHASIPRLADPETPDNAPRGLNSELHPHSKPFPVRVLMRRDAPYNPPEPPRSPLLDEDIFMPYHLKHPKAAPSPHKALTPREWALTLNPYARILATPIRMDCDFHRRLPAALLTRFVLKTHPETGRPMVLPDMIDEGAGRTAAGIGGGQYALGTRTAIELMTPGRGRGGKMWAKLVALALREKVVRTGVWRNDMGAFVLMKLRRRVLHECLEARVSREVDLVAGGPAIWSAAGEVMCVLDFRADRRAAAWVADNDTLLNISPGGWSQDRERPPPMDGAGLMAVVAGRRVPVHPMREMLGEELVAQVEKRWKVCEGHPVIAVMLTQRTYVVQMWLLRLRYYMGLWYAPG